MPNRPREFSLDAPGGASTALETELPGSLPTQKLDKELEANDIENAGAQLAAQMEELGYHPVILFGSAASGKTSLLASLLATVRTEPTLLVTTVLGDPLLSLKSKYGRYLQSRSEAFYFKTVQDFIDGRAPAKTNIQLPFFVPVVFRPKNHSELRFAFMESNGEWYRPDRSSDAFFPVLRSEIENFIRHYQKGITFVHLTPYTQSAVWSQNRDQSADKEDKNEASLAIAGAIGAYEAIRVDKSRDQHIMLVTKWDAHASHQNSLHEVLQWSQDDVEPFVRYHYPQAFAALQGLSVRPDQVSLANYCTGIISGSGVLTLAPDNEHRAAVSAFARELWAWLYGNASHEAGGQRLRPFRKIRADGLMASFWRLLDRIF